MKSVAYLMEQCTLKWKGIESFYCITIPSAGPSDKHALACFEIVVQVPFRVPFRVPFPRRGIQNRIRNRIRNGIHVRILFISPRLRMHWLVLKLYLALPKAYSSIPKRGGTIRTIICIEYAMHGFAEVWGSRGFAVGIPNSIPAKLASASRVPWLRRTTSKHIFLNLQELCSMSLHLD